MGSAINSRNPVLNARSLKSYLFGRISSFGAFVLFIALLPFATFVPTQPASAATLPDCAASGYTKSGTNITITPSHGKVMYIDTGVSPKIDAAYIGYRITNNTASALSGYWVSLTNFRGNVISLANPVDQNQQLVDSYQPLPEVAANSSKTVYFLVKANTSTRVAQTHSVSLYPKRPDATGVVATSECDFTFTKVAETIKASPNKITSISITSGSLSLGQLITVIVQGDTGTIGQGSADVGAILWFSPASFSSFPTAALRLESVTLAVTSDNSINNNTNYRFYDERLLVLPSTVPESSKPANLEFSSGNTPVTTADSAMQGNKRTYKNVYRFRVIGKTSTATSIDPIAQISSGTQIKHTPLGSCNSAGQCTTSISTDTVTVPVTISKGLSVGSFVVGTGSYANYVRASYQVIVSTTTGSSVSVDEIIDTPPSGAILTGSSSYRFGTGSAIAITPIQIDSESSMSPQPYHFIGPFRITSTSALTVNYQMWIPNIQGTFTNTAQAYIGQQVITNSTGYQLPGVSVSVGSGGTITSGSTTTTLNPDPVTLPATVTSGSTYLNGTVDANNQNSVITFEFSQNANLSGYTSVSAGSNTSSSTPVGYQFLFSGSAGTTYYFRIVATTVSGSTRYTGDILSFTTLEPVSTPVASTSIPISVGSTTVTLDGYVDPNMNTMTQVRYRVSTSSTMVTVGSVGKTFSTLSGGSTFIFYDLDATGAVTTTATSISGSSPTYFPLDLTGLSGGTTYYYQIESDYASGTVVGGVKSFKTGTTAQTITFSAGSDVLITLGTKTETGTSSSGSALTYTSEDTTVCTVNSSTGVITFVKVGTCTITASQDGGGTYAAATPVTDSFEILPSAPAVTTGSATSVGQRIATLNGTVNVGGANSTDIHFLYSTNSSQVSSGSGGIRVDADLTPVSANASPTKSLTGLELNTTYYYRVEATNTTGTSAGSVVSFQTLGLTARTLSLSVASASLQFGSATFQSTATPSDGASEGTKSWSSSTTSVCTVNSSTGLVTIQAAGACTLNASITSGSTFGSANAPTLNLTISPRPLTITAGNANCNNCTSAETLTFTQSGTVPGDSVGSVTFRLTSSSPSYDSSTPPTKDVGGPGTYTITPSNAVFSVGNGSNYAITYVAGTYTVTTLLNQTITFTTGSSQTYKTPFTVSASVSSGSAITFSVSGNCTAADPLTVNSGTGTVTITPTAYGTNNCTITASQPGGGTFGEATPVSRTISIAKAQLTITPVAQSRVYGAVVGTYSFSYGSGNFKTDDTIANSVQTEPTCTSDYTTTTPVSDSPRSITCSGGVSTNYSFNYQSANLTITAKPITITATNKSCNNCSSAPAFEFTTNTSLVGSDEISSVTYNFYSATSPNYPSSTTAPTRSIGGAGTYTITPSAAAFSIGSGSNYDISYATGTYSVTVLLDQSITFTTSSPRTYKTPFTVSATSTSGLDITFSVSGDCTAAAPLTVTSGTGTVTITPTAYGTNNCTITAAQGGDGTYGPASSVNQTISVARATLVVTADDKSRTAGDPAPTYTFTYGGFKSGDDETNSITSAPTCTSDYTSSTPATDSPRTISCSGGSATNYTFSYVSGSLTITAASGGGGGGGSGPAPTPVIPAPIITSLSKSEICATGNIIIISGNYFDGARVTLDGTSVVIRSISTISITVVLPQLSGGTRVIRVSTEGGSATANIIYVDVPKPKFVSIFIPYMAQGDFVLLPITATNASSYSTRDRLPSGLVLNPSTGAISGIPTENGIFSFLITATGICGETDQLIELDIDKPTPNAISFRVNLLPNSACMSQSARDSLDLFLQKVREIAPRNLIPDIYISGGGVGDPTALGSERLDCICETFLDAEIYGNVIDGEFTGSPNRIEIIVYWAKP
jgi:hypothetical protein